MSMKFAVINDIINREGGYSNRADDSGGETMYGITEDVARQAGYEGEMDELPRQLAVEIYTQLYWHTLNLDTIEHMSSMLAEEIVDTAVNQGVARAGFFLQRSLNALNNLGKHFDDLVVDGHVGPASLRALGEFLALRGEEGERILHRMLNSLQGAFYVELCERREKDEAFLYGWFRARVI